MTETYDLERKAMLIKSEVCKISNVITTSARFNYVDSLGWIATIDLNSAAIHLEYALADLKLIIAKREAVICKA